MREEGEREGEEGRERGSEGERERGSEGEKGKGGRDDTCLFSLPLVVDVKNLCRP